MVDRSIQNPAEHLRWSMKERLTKTNYSLELFPKDITKYILERYISTTKLLNIPGF